MNFQQNTNVLSMTGTNQFVTTSFNQRIRGIKTFVDGIVCGLYTGLADMLFTAVNVTFQLSGEMIIAAAKMIRIDNTNFSVPTDIEIKTAGNNYITQYNPLVSGGINQISVRSSANGANRITCEDVTTNGYNELNANCVSNGGSNRIYANNGTGYNQIQANGTNGVNIIQATGAIGYNQLDATANYLSSGSTFNWSSTNNNVLIKAGTTLGNVAVEINNVPKLNIDQTNVVTNQRTYLAASTGNFLNRSIEFDTANNVSFIDFHNTTNGDADVRIRTDGGSALFADGYCGIECKAFSTPNQYQLGYSFNGTTNAPLISFAVQWTMDAPYAANNNQYLCGPMPDASRVNNPVKCFKIPFNCRMVGYTISGDTDAHALIAMRFRLGNALAGAGTLYYDQQGTLAANAIQNNAASVNLYGTAYNMTTIITNVGGIQINAGTALFLYGNYSAVMDNECVVTTFFQQLY